MMVSLPGFQPAGHTWRERRGGRGGWGGRSYSRVQTDHRLNFVVNLNNADTKYMYKQAEGEELNQQPQGHVSRKT